MLLVNNANASTSLHKVANENKVHISIFTKLSRRYLEL